MENSDRDELTLEYVKRFSKFQFWVLRAMGFGTFSIKNNRIVEKSWNSVLYGAIVFVTSIIAVTSIIYETSIKTNYILYTELVVLLEVAIIISMFLLNITFGNRYAHSKLIKHGIEIDILLGIKDTEFMRDITDTAYTIMELPIIAVQCTVVIFMYISFKVSLFVHVTGSAYFLWAFFALIYINNIVTNYTFLNLRTRYINVALMKTINVKVEYMPDLFLFNGVFWKPKHDDLVKFHEKADIKKYLKIYKMLFTHLKLYLDCYQFAIFTGILCVTMGSLICVQTIIIYGKQDIDMLRKFIIVSWLVLCWMFLLFISILVDLFSKQIDQTKLICTYAQLRSINDEAVYKFTKAIFRVLEVRVPHASLFGMFFFDPGMMLRMAASIFVYVTAQLQISMPASDKNKFNANVTVS